jgi:ABC-type oligopeptide transport system substrate-binding subunit
MRRYVSLIPVLVCALALLTACGGGNSSPAGGDQPTKVIDVTFNGDDVTPNGTTESVSVGQRVEFLVTADAPGEIHVHSSPEQELQYDKGSTTLTLKPFTAPGVIEVESHALDKVIVKLEVR